jgi:hypothetical protein
MTTQHRTSRNQARVPVLRLRVTDRSASSAEPTTTAQELSKTPLQLVAARRLARW